ncbi:MAG: hypothetical protein LUD12_12275 [Lachnospiraceae bacterium]|nr:hypothetical protein [Lachnospiraceae bacterium]
MTRELTAKELVKLYEGIPVDMTKEDTYGVAIELYKAKLSYEEDYHELTFTGEGFEVTFKDDDNDETIECITYDDETQEVWIEFNEYVPPVTIRSSDYYQKLLEKITRAEKECTDAKENMA